MPDCSVDVGDLDDASLATLKNAGVILRTVDKQDKDGNTIQKGKFVKCKSKEYSPTVIDSKKNVIGPDTLIGNGSLVRVYFKTYEGTGPVKGQNFCGLAVVKVLDLIEYSSDILDQIDDDEEGFVSETTDVELDEDIDVDIEDVG